MESTFRERTETEADIEDMSETLYIGLCSEVGTKRQIAMRRDVMDIHDAIQVNEWSKLKTGSQKEGFRFNDSDFDSMLWFKNWRVIWESSQLQFYHSHRNTRFFISDCLISPPGYALLYPTDKISSSSPVKSKQRASIPSYSVKQMMCPLIQPDSFINGPCVSGEALSESYDNAYGFVSDLWPPPATNWIKRSQQSWPTVNIVQKIVRDGCHFVPTGHKLGLQENLEWRISFSSAEQKLVFSMNHCQFLTYGLLKIFLKEVIKSKIGDQNMSSYHIKTSVFWAIQQSSMSQWCPQNLLERFWVCFKLILKWVYEGVCPNFFIPENNMFIHKIYGAKQMVLFHRLYDLYEKGFLGLLESPKIRSLITSQYQNLRPCVHTLEYTLIPQCEFDSELFEEISANDSAQVINLKQCLIALQSLEETVCWPLTHYQGIMVQKITATILQSTIFILHMCSNKAENRKKYIIDKMAVKVLKLAARFGYTFDTLFIIMYFYKTFRYTKALSVIEKMEAILSRPETYTEVVSDKSLSTKMKQCTVLYSYFDLCNSIPYIDELINLQNHSHQNQWSTLYVPPLVLLHMLKFLCYRHIDTGRAQFVLYDLQYLLNLNGDVIVPNNIRDVSWHILGLCQQLNENISDALYSYTQSLKQKNENRIKMATLMKIREITHDDLNVF